MLTDNPVITNLLDRAISTVTGQNAPSGSPHTAGQGGGTDYSQILDLAGPVLTGGNGVDYTQILQDTGLLDPQQQGRPGTPPFAGQQGSNNDMMMSLLQLAAPMVLGEEKAELVESIPLALDLYNLASDNNFQGQMPLNQALEYGMASAPPQWQMIGGLIQEIF